MCPRRNNIRHSNEQVVHNSTSHCTMTPIHSAGNDKTISARTIVLIQPIFTEWLSLRSSPAVVLSATALDVEVGMLLPCDSSKVFPLCGDYEIQSGDCGEGYCCSKVKVNVGEFKRMN